VRHLIDELLGYVDIEVGHEAEATTLSANWIAHDLSFLHLAELLEMTRKVLVGKPVIEPTDEHFLTDALLQLLLLNLGSAARAIARPTAAASITCVVARGTTGAGCRAF